MSDAPQVSQVVEIKAGCKYIIEVPAWVDDDQARKMHKAIYEWWNGSEPLFIIGGGLMLTKVEDKPIVSKGEQVIQ